MRRRGSLLVAGAGLAAAGLAPGVVFAVLPLGLAGASATVAECACAEVLQRSVPDRVRAFSLGLADTAMVSAALLGALTVPSSVGLVGPVAVFVGLAGLLVGLSRVRRLDRRRFRAAEPRDESVV